VYFIVVDIPLALNRNSAFPGVLSYQNSFSGSKFVVIGGACCQEMRSNALLHKVLRPFTKYLTQITERRLVKGGTYEKL